MANNFFLMWRHVLMLAIPCLHTHCQAQDGWVKDYNPLNELTAYTTSFSYTGASFIEINGDNNVDLFAAPNTLFVNNGDGTFTKVSSLPFAVLNSTAGSSCADLDNDGDNDIIVSSVPSRVFFNDGMGVFSDSSSAVPSFDNYGAFGVAIGDYNKDRHLDFIFAHANGFHSPAAPAPCNFYRQQTGSFSPLALSGYPFTTNLTSYTVPYWSDYDLDGDMDLFIASGPANGTPDFDYCYKNLKVETGNDTLVAMTAELFASETQDGQCYNFIDYDNDGDLDLCITNYYSVATRLYRNDAGVYSSVLTPFTTATTNIANCWGDYDNDGDIDVIITNDNQVTKYYNNDGDGTFTYLPGGFSTPTATNGITNADYDNDGDLDVFTNGVGNNGNTGSVGLYINESVAEGRNSVNLHLIGTLSNQSAIGAIVRVRANIYGHIVWQLREINAQNTFQGQNDLRVHFGLGDATVVDSIIINWPSGAVEHYEGYAANAFYSITEGSGITNLRVGRLPLPISLQVFPNPSQNEIKFSLIGKYSSGLIDYQILDMTGGVAVAGSQKASATNSIDIRMLSPGPYVLKVAMNGVVIATSTISRL